MFSKLIRFICGHRLHGRTNSTSGVSAATFDRMRNPARGRDGGRAGITGTAQLASGKKFTDKAVHTVPEGERFRVELPGGGGLGDPDDREETLIRADLEAGYITKDGAKNDYGFQ